MFFYLSKLFWAVAVPSTFLTVLALAGLVLARFRPRAGLALATLAVLGLLVGGLGPVGRALIQPLEDRFPIFTDDGRPVDGIIVLGGAELPLIFAARGQAAFQESAERLLAMGELARRYPQARVLFSGGSSQLREAPSEADTVRAALPALGLAPERVEFEATSRNTAENARLSKEYAKPAPGERWLLVTSAFHMPRAMGCFRAAGFDVVAYPVDFRTTGSDLDELNRSVSGGLMELDLGVREWIGLIVYRLTGRIGDLLPAP
ncbi:YdcF family protein [Ancylobacter terrae]|uniref:YdcF family protein n=1 Tax=Ancylobacter sp. sgz301288 TaxID=3342077 RepID=UPI00385B0D36